MAKNTLGPAYCLSEEAVFDWFRPPQFKEIHVFHLFHILLSPTHTEATYEARRQKSKYNIFTLLSLFFFNQIIGS